MNENDYTYTYRTEYKDFKEGPYTTHVVGPTIKSAKSSNNSVSYPPPTFSRAELEELLTAMEGRIMQQVCDELTRIEQVITEALKND